MIMMRILAALVVVAGVRATYETQCVNDNDGGIRHNDWKPCGVVESNGVSAHLTES